MILTPLSLIDYDKKLKIDEETYDLWIKENEPSNLAISIQRFKNLGFKFRPLISVMTPVYNTDVTMLTEMIESILNQTYTNWELCIVDGASNEPHIKEILHKYSKQDRRIKIKFLKNNYGISGNSNEALKLIKGDFVALVDHDDIITPDALYEIVKLLNKSPQLDFIYTDKDTITQDGKKRYNPLFKPEWSPDVLFNANYLTHLNIIRTKILRDIGGFDMETDGAQDWDLFIRISLKTDRIAHIPKVLYHWRCHQKSSASGFEAKPYAVNGQIKSVQKYLKQKNLFAEVKINDLNVPQIVWNINKELKISIIIDMNQNLGNLGSFINRCISHSLYNLVEIIVINRTNSQLKVANSDIDITIINFPVKVSTGFAFQTAVNKTTGDILVFINAGLDSQNIELAIHELVGWTQYKEIGVVGGLVLSYDDSVKSTGFIFDKDGTVNSFGSKLHWLEGTLLGHLMWYRNFSALPNLCMAMRKSVLDQVGGFDVELNKTSNIDFCLQVIAKGFRILYSPNAVVKFHRKYKHSPELNENFNEMKIITTRHKSFFENLDPYSNPRIIFTEGKIVLKDIIK